MNGNIPVVCPIDIIETLNIFNHAIIHLFPDYSYKIQFPIKIS